MELMNKTAEADRINWSLGFLHIVEADSDYNKDARLPLDDLHFSSYILSRK